MDEVRYYNALREILEQLLGIDEADLTLAEKRILRIAENALIERS